MGCEAGPQQDASEQGAGGMSAFLVSCLLPYVFPAVDLTAKALSGRASRDPLLLGDLAGSVY